MRIRRSAFRLLGSAYSAHADPPPKLPAPSPILEVCSTLKSHDVDGSLSPVTAPEGPCKFNRSPWDLLDDLSLSDPQEVDDLLDSYCVNTNYRTCRLSSTSMPVTSMKKDNMTDMATTSMNTAQLMSLNKKKTLKKVAMKEEENKEGEAQKNAKVKKQEGEEGESETWDCKKNDGKGWHCPYKASRPNSLCEHHSKKKPSYLNLEFASLVDEEKVMATTPKVASKPSTRCNTRKKQPANNYNAAEGFYYYTGFGPSRSNKRCWSSSHDLAPPSPNKEEEVGQDKVEIEDGSNGATGSGVCSSDNIYDVAGIDEWRNNNDYGEGSSARNNINMESKKNPRNRLRKTENEGAVT